MTGDDVDIEESQGIVAVVLPRLVH